MTGQEIIRNLVGAGYGGYCVYNAIMALRDKKWPPAEYLMIAGGVLLAVVGFVPDAPLFVIFPILIIQAAAIMRDKRAKVVNLTSHVFRMVICLFILLFYSFT